MKKLRMKDKAMVTSLTAARKLVLVVFMACGFSCVAANAQENPPPHPARLDTQITPANSVLVDFGGGAILRVPKLLIAETMIPKDLKQPIKMEQISMVFQYPDMVETTYSSPMTLIIERTEGRHVRTPDVFPVYVKSLFHSEEVPAHNGAGGMVIIGHKLRPVTLLERLAANVKENAKEHHVVDDKITFSDAKYEGLREIHIPVTDPAYKERSEKTWRASGWDGKYEVKYVERVGNPYELYMECDPVDSPNSSKCDADVYIKHNHFQYHMIFPPEGVAHTDQLIRKVNKMISGWVQK